MVKVARSPTHSVNRFLRTTDGVVIRLSTMATASASSMIAILTFKKHT